MKSFKRILSVFLVVLMVVGSVPVCSLLSKAAYTNDWNLSGVCNYDEESGSYILNNDTYWSTGTMQYINPVSNNFEISMDYYTGNRSGGTDSRNGGDGFAVNFYADSIRRSEYWRPSSGYSVEIDTYCDDGFEKKEIHTNHVAINTNKLNHIAVSPITEAEDDGWHSLTINVLDGVCTVYIDGTERISAKTPATGYNKLGIYCSTGAAKNKHAVKNIKVRLDGEQFPSGYNFYEDSYNFTNNQGADIDVKYFNSIFESGTASLAYESYHNAAGLCYGFAFTTASIYNGLPDVSRWATTSFTYANTIRDLYRENWVNLGSAAYVPGDFNGCITTSDFIKYAFIYQYSVEANQRLNSSSNNAKDLLNLVRSFVDNNTMGIAIGFTPLNKYAVRGHEVLAVGYDGNSILIDNPNNSSKLEKLTVHEDGSWEFGRYNNNDHWLDWDTSVYRPYQILSTGNKVVADVKSNSQERTNTVSGVEKLNPEYNLVKITSSDYVIGNTDYIEIAESKSGYKENIGNTSMLWIEEGPISVKMNSENSEVECAGDDSVISVSTYKESLVDVDIQQMATSIKTDENSNVKISIKSINEKDNLETESIEISVLGTTDTDNVTANQTENGIEITGISDGTVILSKDDEIVAEEAISCADGIIEIEYDKTGESTDIKADYDEEHIDKNNDGRCDSCGASTGTNTPTQNCSCNCHKSGFIGFFWKITNFFNKIFKKNQYCACGAKHW